jgi:hypothetical protein
MLRVRVLALAIIFGVFAGFDWKRLPLLARFSLGVATVFLIGALTHPGMGIAELVDPPQDGVSWLVFLARPVAAAVAVCSLLTAARDYATE